MPPIPIQKQHLIQPETGLLQPLFCHVARPVARRVRWKHGARVGRGGAGGGHAASGDGLLGGLAGAVLVGERHLPFGTEMAFVLAHPSLIK